MSVYFIQDGDGGPVKIGYASDPRERLSQLQCANHRPLRMIRLVTGGQETEFSAHAAFNHLRIRGEWFDFSADMLLWGNPDDSWRSWILQKSLAKSPARTPLSEYLATEGARKQAEIAEAVNVSRVFISLVASGQRQPSLPVALKIEAATDGKVSVAELVKPATSTPELREAS